MSDINPTRDPSEPMQVVAARRDRRASTLARMAGNIAAAFVSRADTTAAADTVAIIASLSVDIATAILDEIDRRATGGAR